MTAVTPSRTHRLSLRLAGATIAVTLVGASCANSADDSVRLDSIAPVAALTPFDSCDGLLDYFQAEAQERVGPYGLGGTGPYLPFEGDVALAESGDAATREVEQTPAGVGGPTVSGTNVQEAGVDEPDIVKADRERMIVVSDDRLVVIDLTGDTPQVAGRLDLPSGYDHEMLVAGDRALVLTREFDRGYRSDTVTEELRAFPSTTLTAVDLTDPETPRVTETVRIESNYVSARMQGTVARVVVTSGAPALAFVYPAEPGEAGERRAQAVNEAVIEESTLADWLPGWTIDDQSSGRLDDCDSIHRPADFAGFGLVSILTVDLDDGLGPPDAVSVVGAGDTVYASADNLYVATERLRDEPTPDEATARPTDEPIEFVPPTEDVRTSIHRFSAPADGPVSYEASGEVEGRLLNQFSLSEHDGVLRVATTRGEPWLTESSDSLVTTLERVGDQLVEIGRVENLGRGEQIFAVRFVGPVGYVVTFRQTDPLYVIDLRDPTAPMVTGELKILGYSAYLHPIDDTLVLGVGQDADEFGATSGTQISLFDVSNPTAPVRTDQITVPGGSSEVEWDHRAFLWWAPTATAVLPVESYTRGSSSAAVVIDVDAETQSLTERGRVEHRSSPVRRSVVIDDVLVTLDGSGAVFSSLADLTPVAELAL